MSSRRGEEEGKKGGVLGWLVWLRCLSSYPEGGKGGRREEEGGESRLGLVVVVGKQEEEVRRGEKKCYLEKNDFWCGSFLRREG